MVVEVVVVAATVVLVEVVVVGKAVVGVVAGHLGEEVLEEMAAVAAVPEVAAAALVSYICLGNHSLIFLILTSQIMFFITRVFLMKATIMIIVLKKPVVHRSVLIF